VQPSEATAYLHRRVDVVVDRPKGSFHPEHGFVYPVNYGFIPGTRSGDNEALDAYVLGVEEQLAHFRGRCIAVIRRLNDQDDKLIVVPDGAALTDDPIRDLTDFQEQFFQSEILRPAPPPPQPSPAGWLRGQPVYGCGAGVLQKGTHAPQQGNMRRGSRSAPRPGDRLAAGTG
jgi:inorganic pyrophosphatase